MCAQLEAIGLETLQRYQTLYAKHWPRYCAEFYCLDNFIGFLQKDPQIRNVKAYTLADRRASDAALFVIVDRYQLFVGCLNDAHELLEQALRLLDWSNGMKCSSVPARHIEAVRSVVREKRLAVEYDDPTLLYYMPAAQALQLQVDVPTGFHMDTLRQQDAELVNREWPNHHVGSLYFVQRQIRLCINAGLYTSTDTPQLVAWCLRLQGGYLGALQVLNTHKRRGFGSLVTKEISRRIATQGQDVMALVNAENTASRGMFEKLGFRAIDQCVWLRTLPVAGEFVWPDGQ
ncbi:hypothetical protein KR222_010037 [Zaprionus bogoriensis]|nr:hypothetical protein KR222_010037 [Zaprionus bogoriensis]